MKLEEIVCDVCGNPPVIVDGTLEINSTKDERTEIYCNLCRGLIDAGMLRAETVDGKLRYRQWFPEWKPGELIGAP